MKTCIVGVGAVGGLIGTRLAAAGDARVSAFARGATLSALRTHGWRARTADRLLQAPVAAASDVAEDLGPQDLVIVCVKGPAMPAIARAIEPLLGGHTIVLPLMNGVPWWFGSGVAALGNEPLRTVDPDGEVERAIATSRVLGGVVHLSVQAPEPGLAVHRMGNGLIVGEPGGGTSDRAVQVGALLTKSGFDVTASDSVRRDVWYKLWGNLTMNPVSALTGATADRILDDELVRALSTAAMREARTIGALLGCPIQQEPEERHQVTRNLGAFKTSMLQDVEAGRPIELDAIVGAVRELGQRLGVATPTIDALYGLTRLMARTRGLYPPAA